VVDATAVPHLSPLFITDFRGEHTVCVSPPSSQTVTDRAHAPSHSCLASETDCTRRWHAALSDPDIGAHLNALSSPSTECPLGWQSCC
jgi:hypothetical protein